MFLTNCLLVKPENFTTNEQTKAMDDFITVSDELAKQLTALNTVYEHEIQPWIRSKQPNGDNVINGKCKCSKVKMNWN